MATYDSIHLRATDREAILGAISAYGRKHEWWRFWRRDKYSVSEPVGEWTEVIMSRSCIGAKKLTEFLSAALGCTALALGYETVVGCQCIRLCEGGFTKRLLWYCWEGDLVIEEGIALSFEEEFVQKKRAAVQQELAEMDPEDRAEAAEPMLRRSYLQPQCKDFAEELGCASYLRE